MIWFDPGAYECGEYLLRNIESCAAFAMEAVTVKYHMNQYLLAVRPGGTDYGPSYHQGNRI